MKSRCRGRDPADRCHRRRISAPRPQVYGYRFRGQRFDCGSKAGFLQATVAFALARDDLRDDLSRYLTEIAQLDKAAQ